MIKDEKVAPLQQIKPQNHYNQLNFQPTIKTKKVPPYFNRVGLFQKQNYALISFFGKIILYKNLTRGPAITICKKYAIGKFNTVVSSQ